MPKSFASSRLPLSALRLVTLTLLAAGCSDAKDVDYGATNVQSAFAAEGVALYGPQQTIPDDPLTPPAARARAEQRPLTAMLKGIRNAVLVPNVNPGSRPTVPPPTAGLAAQTIAKMISTSNHIAHSALPRIGMRAPRIGPPATGGGDGECCGGSCCSDSIGMLLAQAAWPGT